MILEPRTVLFPSLIWEAILNYGLFHTIHGFPTCSNQTHLCNLLSIWYSHGTVPFRPSPPDMSKLHNKSLSLEIFNIWTRDFESRRLIRCIGLLLILMRGVVKKWECKWPTRRRMPVLHFHHDQSTLNPNWWLSERGWVGLGLGVLGWDGVMEVNT